MDADEMYKLSTTLEGHELDVRSVKEATRSNHFITGSRDCTARTWKPNETGTEYVANMTYPDHGGKYVTTVSVQPPSEDHPNGLLLTGSQDGKVRAFAPDSDTVVYTLEAHEGAVTSIHCRFTTITGSWDKTAKVWAGQKAIMTLRGHEAAVWDVAILSEAGLILTASADRTIKMWKGGALQQTLIGHTDCVRGLAVLGSTSEFLSVSNDATVKRWNAATADCLATYYGHENYIYNIALMPNKTDFVTVSEDKTIRIWKCGEIAQTLTLPVETVWSVAVLSSGDIVAGASDRKVWVFSRAPERQAAPDVQAAYADAVASQKWAAQSTLGDVKVEDISGPEALLVAGSKEGQMKMVREGSNITVHQWSMAEEKWQKIGDVTGAPKNQKKIHEGREFDFVFDIEIEDPKATLKLPYNTSEDPWMAAQQFIHSHNLPQDHLEQVANFIVTNTGGQPLGTGGVGRAADPLTGGGAYVSGSGGYEPPPQRRSRSGVAADPLTGGGAYVSGSGGYEPAREKPRSGLSADPLTGNGAHVSGDGSSNGVAHPMDIDDAAHFPQTTLLSFMQQPKVGAMLAKLKEFNARVPEECRVEPDSNLDSLPDLCDPSKAPDGAVPCLMKVLSWPKDQVFPALDILRLAIFHPRLKATFQEEGVIDNLFSLLFTNISPKSTSTCQMLALRTLVNLFSIEECRKKLLQLRDSVITRVSAMFPTDNKNVQIAMATLMLNYCVALSGAAEPSEGQAQCLTSLGLLFLDSDAITDPEAKYRTLVALGTLLSGKHAEQNARIAHDMDVAIKVQHWKQLEDTDKIQRCAQLIIQNFF